MPTILTHVVLRVTRDTGGKRLPGELVDAREWPLTAKLVDQRRIAPVPPGIVPVRTVDGRWWVEGKYPKEYGLQIQRPVAQVPQLQGTTSVEAAPEEPATTAEPDADQAAPVADLGNTYPERVGQSSHYLLSDGTKVQGKAKAIAAEAALHGEGDT
jgi:hypothetical protein